MSKKNIVTIGFIIVCIGTAYVQFITSTPTNKTVQRSQLSVTQIILGVKKKEPVNSNSTALQLLNMSHKVVMQGKNENAFVTTIDGRTADPQKKEFWAFYVNGKQAQVGAGGYFLKENDTIEWKIESY